jgi:hypothetical protein
MINIGVGARAIRRLLERHESTSPGARVDR